MTLVFLMTACGSKTIKKFTTPHSGGTATDLATFSNGDPSHIDPALASDPQSGEIASLIYDGLTRTDTKGNVQNEIASSVTPNANDTVWTFVLRKDAKFTNGDPVLPSSFVNGWTRALNPALASPASNYLMWITGAPEVRSGAASALAGAVADDAAGTLTISLVGPMPDFPAVVSMPVFSPLPASVISPAHPEVAPAGSSYTEWEGGLMIGDGPFKMVTPWAHNDQILLVRNDEYYGGANNRKAYLDAVNFKISKDVTTAYNAFTAKQGDLAQIIPTQFAQAEASGAGELVNDALMATEYWGFNMTNPVVGGDANVKLRQAIAMTIDRKDMNINFYGDTDVPATGWAPQITPGYQVRIVSGDRNVEAAKDLIRSNHIALPPITVSFPNTALPAAEANVVKSNLADIGITATLDPVDPSTYQSKLAAGQMQFFYGTWQANFMSYDDIITPPFATGAPTNATKYSSADFDATVGHARATPDAAARSGLYQHAEDVMLKSYPVVPTEWLYTQLIRSVDLQDLHVNPTGYLDYTDAWLSR